MQLVLVVDDFPESVDALFALLDEKGFAVALALDGEEAVRAVKDRRPDVIVMDLAMPKVDGLEAARRIKGDPATRSIPIVIYTAHVGAELQVICEGLGVDCVFGKPDSAPNVVSAVERLCAA